MYESRAIEVLGLHKAVASMWVHIVCFPCCHIAYMMSCCDCFFVLVSLVPYLFVYLCLLIEKSAKKPLFVRTFVSLILDFVVVVVVDNCVPALATLFTS